MRTGNWVTGFARASPSERSRGPLDPRTPGRGRGRRGRGHRRPRGMRGGSGAGERVLGARDSCVRWRTIPQAPPVGRPSRGPGGAARRGADARQALMNIGGARFARGEEAGRIGARAGPGAGAGGFDGDRGRRGPHMAGPCRPACAATRWRRNTRGPGSTTASDTTSKAGALPGRGPGRHQARDGRVGGGGRLGRGGASPRRGRDRQR